MRDGVDAVDSPSLHPHHPSRMPRDRDDKRAHRCHHTEPGTEGGRSSGSIPIWQWATLPAAGSGRSAEGHRAAPGGAGSGSVPLSGSRRMLPELFHSVNYVPQYSEGCCGSPCGPKVLDEVGNSIEPRVAGHCRLCPASWRRRQEGIREVQREGPNRVQGITLIPEFCTEQLKND